jgi:hypothetical protein
MICALGLLMQLQVYCKLVPASGCVRHTGTVLVLVLLLTVVAAIHYLQLLLLSGSIHCCIAGQAVEQ